MVMSFPPESAARNKPRRTASTRPTGAPSALVAFAKRPRRPGPAPARGARSTDTAPTRDLIFTAAATAFSRDGFDGVGVDDIARAAGVNKAMLYYHYKDKLTLYREVVRDMLRALGGRVSVVAESDDAPPRKIERFIETLAAMREERPWWPPLMMRELAAGAPRLDTPTLTHMRGVSLAFASIIEAGVASGDFRPVNPLMAYMSIMGPLMMNAARERAAAAHGRSHLPVFATVDRRELIAHMQLTALSMLRKDTSR